MAVEETEYYSLHQGNGVSGGVRETRSKPAKKKKVAGTGRSRSGVTSFLQGITLGTVLLIPVGVWCWVRVDDIAPTAETQEVQSKAKTAAKGKAAPAATKRKPLRAVPVVAAPARVLDSDAGIKIKALVDVEPPPLVVAPPVAVSIPIATDPIQKLAEDVGSSQKPEKRVWRTISAPFRGKSNSQN